MAVTMAKLDKAMAEVKRFSKAVAAVRLRVSCDKWVEDGDTCKETGAVRRASMELTRVLVDIRS